MLNLDKLTESARPALASPSFRSVLKLGLYAVAIFLAIIGVRMVLSFLLAGWLTSKLGMGGLSENLLTAISVALFPVLDALLGGVWKPTAAGARSRAMLALVCAALLSLGSLFNEGAQRYYSITPDGIVYSDKPGRDSKYLRELKPVTPEVAVMLSIIEQRKFFRVDPARSHWFHPNTKDPVLWYTRGSAGEPLFFSRYGYSPDTGEELQAVTAELRAEWNSQRSQRKGARR